MGAHRGLQHLGRQAHEIGVDRSRQHDRELGETRYLVEQPRIGLDGSAQLGRAAVEIGADQLAALVLVEDDVSVLQFFEVFGGAVGAKLARRQKTVAAGGAADRDVIDRQRHDFAVEQADDRGQRPHPAQRRTRPAHRFRPGQFGNRRLDQLRQYLGRGPARTPDDREIEFAAASVADLAFTRSS